MRWILCFLACICIFSVVFVLCRQVKPEKLSDEGVDFEKEAIDPELVGVVTLTMHVQYISNWRYTENRHAIARYDTTYASGKLRVRKFVLGGPFRGYESEDHDKIYQYFREDGTIESERLLQAAYRLNGGAYIRTRLRLFDEAGVMGDELHFREDGTLALRFNESEDVFQQIRRDGKTLRYESKPVNGETHQIWYRKDGATIWFESLGSELRHVHFDLDGNPVDWRYMRHYEPGDLGMGPGAEPLLVFKDHYLREDGTLSYVQSWYWRWEESTNTVVNALGEVTVYDKTGESPAAQYKLMLRSPGLPRFVTESTIWLGHGKTEWRKYDDPQDFTAQIAETLFQGIDCNLWGTYDDETHDI